MITIKRTQKTLTVSGHAGYAERGKDIVCEAVTSQVQTLTEAIGQLAHEKPVFSISSGFYELDLEELGDKSLFLVSAFMVGMRLLQDGYPEHVKVI
jgi:uncharacterized protein YsxB (DUF464 family)